MLKRSGWIKKFKPWNEYNSWTSLWRHFEWGSLHFSVLKGLATWLILPVVICLSQRLSHAGLSISWNKVKPRMAHYISYGSLDLRYLTWITLEILELIHAKVVPSLVWGTFLLDQNQSGSNLCPFGESEQLWADRTVLYWRPLFQMSALSTWW